MQFQIRPIETRYLFLLLTLAHILHAIEEYSGKLWEVYEPAIFICNLISSNPQTGFIIINTLYVLASLGYFFSIQKNQSFANTLIWVFIVLQTINAGGHIIWTISRKAYTPGVATAFIILFIVISLARRLLKRNRPLPV